MDLILRKILCAFLCYTSERTLLRDHDCLIVSRFKSELRENVRLTIAGNGVKTRSIAGISMYRFVERFARVFSFGSRKAEPSENLEAESSSAPTSVRPAPSNAKHVASRSSSKPARARVRARKSSRKERPAIKMAKRSARGGAANGSARLGASSGPEPSDSDSAALPTRRSSRIRNKTAGTSL